MQVTWQSVKFCKCSGFFKKKKKRKKSETDFKWWPHVGSPENSSSKQDATVVYAGCKHRAKYAVFCRSVERSGWKMKDLKMSIKWTVVPHSDRFRPHPGERRLVVGADVVVRGGGQEAGRGADCQRTLGQVWTPLLLQVTAPDDVKLNSSFSWVHRWFDYAADVPIKIWRGSASFKTFRLFGQPQNHICLLWPTPPAQPTCCPHALSRIPILNSPSWEVQKVDLESKFLVAGDFHLPTETSQI